jgi:hypothetical protein
VVRRQDRGAPALPGPPAEIETHAQVRVPTNRCSAPFWVLRSEFGTKATDGHSLVRASVVLDYGDALRIAIRTGRARPDGEERAIRLVVFKEAIILDPGISSAPDNGAWNPGRNRRFAP